MIAISIDKKRATPLNIGETTWKPPFPIESKIKMVIQVKDNSLLFAVKTIGM